jgi:hypothetical protein
MTPASSQRAPDESPVNGSAPIYSADLSGDPPGPPEAGLIGLKARWRLVPAGWKAVIIVAVAVIAGAGLIRLASAVSEGSAPEGPQSSSFSPTPQGLAAYSQLLSASSVRVVQLTAPLGQATFPVRATVVVAAPSSWSAQYSTALAKLLRSGGRVVVAGEPPPGLLSALVGENRAPTWSGQPIETSRAVGASPLVFGVEQVDSTGPGAWSAIKGADPLLASGSTYLAVSEHVGPGTLVLLASPSPLQDRLIDRADNAAFAIDIGTSSGRLVVFDEYDHGYGKSGEGFAGLPYSWQTALLIALAAVIIWLLSAARRFGPPEATERDLAPPRVAYVDAIATLMSTAPPDRVASATSSVQARAREGLCRRIGAPADATDWEIERAASSAGVRHDLVTAVLSAPRTTDELVAVGRASSELAREQRP